MSLQMQTFSSFTLKMWAALVEKIKADTGVETTEYEGTVVHGSFTFTYAYDPESQVLVLQCQKKPFFLPASTVVNGLAEEVHELMTANS